MPGLLPFSTKSCIAFTGATLSADVSKSAATRFWMSLSPGWMTNSPWMGRRWWPSAPACWQEATDPNLVDGAFPEKDVELEKQYLIDSIEAEINDKRAYAINKCRTIMCEGEPAALRKYGYVEGCKEDHPQSAVETFLRVRRTARVEILFVGCGDCTLLKRLWRPPLPSWTRRPSPCRNRCGSPPPPR